MTRNRFGSWKWLGGFSAVLLASTIAFAAAPTEGALQALDKDHNPMGVCPLKHTEVGVDISGFVARVTVTQEFGNPYTEPIEAVYTFPMSDRAAVDAMTMTIGDRIIKGVIKKREEARQIYEDAKRAGKTASLLDQERPNIFTQSVANVLPGSKILIEISYVEYLKHEEGEYEFSFPMVVGPRYIPGGTAPIPQQADGTISRVPGTPQVPDAERITPPVTPEGTRAGHDISLTARVDAGMAIQDVRSELHEVDIERPGESQAVIKLKNKNEIPNRDFVLKYKLAGKGIGDAVLTHADARGGFFTLILEPPARVTTDQVTPKEMIFVIDSSGSMRGFPIEKAKKTMRMCIEQMNPNDRFNLVSFSGGLGYCFSGPVPNSAENRRKALEYLDGLEGSGGTEMMPAIRTALEGQNDGKRLRVVCFMTDGFIGNDMAILDAIQKNARTARVFSFGVGNGVNRFLIEGMARAGRGAAEVVTLESDGDAAAKRFHERTQNPVLTDITVDFGNLPVEEVLPDPEGIPDLFSSQPVVLKGRYRGSAQGSITIRGNTAAGPYDRSVAVDLPAAAAEHDVLAPLWARARIEWLMDRDWLGIQQGRPDPKNKEAITQLGLDFSLVTQFTSFVAVEEKVVTEGGQPKKVDVPVEMTDGVSYEGVFGPQHQMVVGRTLRQSPGAAAGAMVMADKAAMPMAEQAFSSMAAPMPPPPLPSSVSSTAVQMPTAPPKPPTQAPEAKPEVRVGKGHAKIAPSLQGLAEKLVNGNYTQGDVRVKDGWVEVFVYLTDDSQERLSTLRNLGVQIVSHASSGKMVHARVRVADLEKVAELDFVGRITPPTF
jgi:Ca-activated chloride channel family protein